MIRLLLCIALGLPNARASEVKRADLHFVKDAYRYSFVIDVNAPLPAVRKLVTDFGNYQRINHQIVHSEILARYDDDKVKRHMLLKHCVLMFCFDLSFVENVEKTEDGGVHAVIAPGEGSFKRGSATWQLEALGGGRTRVNVKAEHSPNFWIPPIIGPMVMKRSFLREVENTATSIENAANDA